MNVPRETIESAHLDSIRNKESIKNSILCGCYFCLDIFPADYVEEFLEESNGDSTALCPNCHTQQPTSKGYNTTYMKNKIRNKI